MQQNFCKFVCYDIHNSRIARKDPRPAATVRSTARGATDELCDAGSAGTLPAILLRKCKRTAINADCYCRQINPPAADPCLLLTGAGKSVLSLSYKFIRSRRTLSKNFSSCNLVPTFVIQYVQIRSVGGLPFFMHIQKQSANEPVAGLAMPKEVTLPKGRCRIVGIPTLRDKE